MSTCININGVITAPGEAKISVLDHGVLFGDSVYETLRTYEGKPFLFSRHFARLEHSAAGINLEIPWSRPATLEQVLRTVGTAPGESRIRLMVTRGSGGLDPDIETCADPAVIIIAVPLVAPPARIYETGVDAVISSLRRGGRFADIKTGSLIQQVLARQEAKSKHAFEAILLTPDGNLSDGITSNIYMVRDGKLLTPSREAGIVEGITRGVVLELAQHAGMTVIEGVFSAGTIETASEMFLTSTTREVVPIVRVDGKPIGDGRPGPVATELLQRYREAIRQLATED